MDERSPHTTITAMDEPIDIFISYAKEDRSRVEALVTLFEAQEWRVWWDTDIPPGKTWREIIEQDTPEETYGSFDAVLSPDGKTLVKVDGSSPKVYICDLCGSIDDLLTVAKQRAPRNFTPEEITLFGL